MKITKDNVVSALMSKDSEKIELASDFYFDQGSKSKNEIQKSFIEEVSKIDSSHSGIISFINDLKLLGLEDQLAGNLSRQADIHFDLDFKTNIQNDKVDAVNYLSSFTELSRVDLIRYELSIAEEIISIYEDISSCEGEDISEFDSRIGKLNAMFESKLSDKSISNIDKVVNQLIEDNGIDKEQFIKTMQQAEVHTNSFEVEKPIENPKIEDVSTKEPVVEVKKAKISHQLTLDF